MDEKANLIAKITEEEKKKAKADKLNAAQTKLYVDEEVKKALAEYEEKMGISAIPTAPAQTKNVAEDKVVTQKKEQKTEKKIKRYLVHTPVKNFCGEVAGVQFAYGKAEVKPGWVLNWFKERGYDIEEVGN